MNPSSENAQRVTVIDYGMGNVRALVYKLQKLGAKARIASDASELQEDSRLILPGVGHFAEGMKQLEARGFKQALGHWVLEKHTPILGICLGMQLLGTFSEEGHCEGLGYLNMRFSRFEPKADIKVPHVSWQSVEFTKANKLFEGVPSPARFYFTHSYYTQDKAAGKPQVLSHYGVPFVCAIQSKNIMGTQFHPEKSHRAGRQILNNFVWGDF